MFIRKQLNRKMALPVLLALASMTPTKAQWLTQTPTGFLYPTGSTPYSATHDNTCSGFAATSPDMGLGGCYPFPSTYHDGYDIFFQPQNGSPMQGTPVQLIADGVVTQISYNGWTCGSTSNVAVIVRHYGYDGLEFRALYGHLDISTVPQGILAADGTTSFPVGTVIGHVGDWCYGPHLHFGIYVPQWGRSESLPYEDGSTPDEIGYGRIGSDHWPNFFGWAHPINFIEFFESPTPDSMAKADMEQYMQNNTPYGGNPIISSFGSNTAWSPYWQLRWMYFGYMFNGNQNYTAVFQALNTSDRNIRYVSYFDPYGNFQGWFPVSQ